MCVVGIDIAAKSFDLVVRRNGTNAKVRRFEQTPAGHAQAAAHLKKLAPERVVMEATGVYFVDLAVALHAAGLPVSVINPRSFKHFAQIKLKGSKTDAIDAALLAEYAQRMAPALWVPPAPDRLALRDLGRQINRLIHARTQAKNRLHALQARRDVSALLIDDEREGIEQLDARIERLKGAAQQRIEQCAQLSVMAQHLRCAKGLGAASTLAILAELCVLPTQMNSAQVSCFAGLDVRLNQSGSSVHRPGRLSKAGNAYLRAALFMPAMVAVQSDPNAKAFYEALLARGKKRIQALCALMRKMLTGIWACIRNGTPFDSSRLFSCAQTLLKA
ncbi:IS110 family RNA-guided transposase [Pseudazoarcus pumilus]|uniref:IS110 family transposase n=1 Tax=Pseudazoarcus pumilus TaxID=2067960 RepID=A0A2I6S8Q2_9RHOO|nr:IS110 family transposase [Pseudazoarcus pumilus]AUN95561.1 IS110 family transposase [Pseudazoarcus pumilus]AUN95625.1 IS110 family transposase [Pseudazoarcus pumilus]